jgi:hypothetical protein
MKIIRVKILNINLHQVFFSIITVVLISTIRYIFMIQPWDLSANIYTGVFCVFFRLLFIDYFKEWLNESGFNFQVGQVLWGCHYIDGDHNSNTVIIKNTEIKLNDKSFKVDNNNDERRNTQ